ncbi:hypothetical protein LCGC14_0971510 [marine sediment metagenome]|uniref:Uncharacterized protein n=1 Tax=marine sediment metagenome TaxID=412755 RepID=A0A0F9NG16_9ZZZZ
MSKQYIDVTYRDIAKMMSSALPVNGDDFGLKVGETLEIIKSLPQEAKIALKVAYVFSRKVPRQEREDLYQDIALAVFKAHTKEERLAYAIARCDWKNWWSRYKIRQHTSLDSVTEDNEGNPVTLAELLVGETEFEFKMDGKLDAERIWDKLPANIKPLVQNRLLGFALTHKERNTMNYFVKTKGTQLLLA